MATSLALAAFVISCVPANDPDQGLAGTYVMSGQLTVHGAGGAVVTPLADETVVVKRASRHYQGFSYEIKVRGCTFEGVGDRTAAGIRSLPCNLRGLDAGTEVRAGGHIVQNGQQTELLLVQDQVPSDAGTSEWFEYFVHASPKR
jgi:hypothetical protein